MGFLYDLFIEFITEHRGIFVTVFVLPISLCFDVYFRIRAWVIFNLYSAPKLHESRVKNIQKQIKAWHDSETKAKLCTSRGGWQSISPSMRTYKNQAHTIDVNLYDILSLDKEAGWVHVEPMVNMGQLSHFLVPHGLTIPVLPEMDDLTVGGLLMGVGIETSSHKYGLFNDCVIEAEIILSSGEVVVCSKDTNRELWDAIPWSYGTLGFLMSCKIKVIPSKPFIRIEYIPCHSQTEYVKLFQEYSTQENPPDFLEALGYSREKAVVMPSNFVDAKDVPQSQINPIGRWYKPWFYKHVESFLEKGKHVEYIPTRDYFHRHTKSIFWELEEIIPWGNNVFFRWLLGWAVPPKASFLKLSQGPKLRELYETQHVIQDMLVPIDKMAEAINVFDDKVEVWPMWLCPYRAVDYSDADAPHRHFLRKPESPTKMKNYLGDSPISAEMYIDIGIYGTPQACKEKKPFDVVKVSREIEDYVQSVHGFQMLYATSYLTQDEFRAMFDHSHYDKMKAKYDKADGFPSIFKKVTKRGQSSWGGEGDKKKD